MKRRHPIEALVRLAKLRERRARADLGQTQSDVSTKTQTVEEQRSEMLALLSESQPLPAHLATALRLQGIASAELLALAAEELESSHRHLAEDRRKWQEAAHDLNAKEELEAKRKREHATIAARAAERALDEVVAARYRGDSS